MKSAYSTLGIPGNASAQDIEAAYLQAAAHYSHERLGNEPATADKLLEIREAHKLLSNPELRAAHDRKLAAAVAIPTSRPSQRERLPMEEVAPAWYTRPMVLLALVVVAIFAMGSYVSHSREQTRRAIAAAELAQKKLDSEEAARTDAERLRLENEKARALAQQQRQEQQLRNESNYAANRAASADQQQQSMHNRQIEADRREAQRKEQQAAYDERQRVAESRRIVAADQARLRELCWRRYQTANC
jgi:curved DNA-binding protein CbpA